MRLGVAGLCLLVATIACAQVPPGWFPFVISDLDATSPVSRAGLNPRPAGADGFVTIKDGHFFDGRGQRLRFLGTNVTFASAFPDKDLAPLIAQRLASLGINIVRFHHLDSTTSPRGIFDPAFKDLQHLDAGQLDRFDWFIYQLKLRGIYTNLNLHVSRTLGKAQGFVEDPSLDHYNKGLDNFVAGMIALQKNYARDLLTHENPYTKTRYVSEPCVAVVELNNENSLLAFAHTRKLHELPEPYLAELRGYWLDYLRAKYKDTAGLRKVWAEGSEPLGEELLRNADLSQGRREWVLESKHPQEDVLEVVEDPAVGKALHARLVQLGVNPWDFQVHQVGHTFENGKLYTLRFKIRAVPARTVDVGTRWDVTDWRACGLSERLQATEQWKEYVLPFRAKDTNPGHCRVSFNCQNLLGDVWVAGVSLRPGGMLGLPPDQTLEAGNVAFPTSSSTSLARRDWFAFIMDLERRYSLGLYETLKRDLGLHAQVVDTQASYGGLGGQVRESRLDYIDNHAYWQHPRFPGKPWDPVNWLISNSPMTDRPDSNTLTALARGRIAGKPYTISEYDHPAPSDYRAEGIPMLATFAGLQDWDGIYQFDYGQTPADWSQARLSGYFQMVTDPAKLAFMPVAANLFRRRDVQAAKQLRRLYVPEERVPALLAEYGASPQKLWDDQGLPQSAAILHRVALQWRKGEVAAEKTEIPDPTRLRSDTGEVEWRLPAEKQGAFLVDTPRTKLAAGRLAGQELRWGGLTAQVTPGATGHATVALTSLDDQPLLRSRRMLLVAVSRVENQAMKWDEQRQTVGKNWGTGPTIIEQVVVEAQAPAGLKVTPLDGTGKPLGLALTATEGRLHLAAPTVWYLVER